MASLRTVSRRLAGLSLLLLVSAPCALRAQVTPGSSGATTSTTTSTVRSSTTSETTTFSRDQTFVISGSNVNTPGPLTIRGPALGGVTAVDTSSTSAEIRVTGSDSVAIPSLLLNPRLEASVRDPAVDFDLAVTQSTPGLTQVQKSNTETTTTQQQTSLSVFTAPFVP